MPSLEEVSMSKFVQAEGIQPEIAVQAIPEDERVWVPQADNVWFRPLLLNTVSGGWSNLLRVRKSGVLSRHRHPMIVTGYVVKGSWRYLEHDWVATEGSFVYEPPGEIHTLVVDEGVPEMITFFTISGAMIYLDEAGQMNGYEDVFTKIDSRSCGARSRDSRAARRCRSRSDRCSRNSRKSCPRWCGSGTAASTRER
jgi:2,4'-dihydroxyacetophenone dioxygenase